ncbi:MAG: flagellar motor switch protein FliM [Oscillospiraceae bacterium]
MNEVLSQSEIDALLSELTLGESSPDKLVGPVDTSNIKPYDFKTANRFPKEQIRTINIVMTNYVQFLSSYLSGILRVNCEIDTLPIEELSFYEFNNALPTPVILAIVSAPPMEGSILIQLSSEVADAIVSRLLGGVNASSESKRAFTEIELAILERIIKQMLGFFDEAWMKVIRVRSRLERIETSSQFAQIVDINEPVALVTMNVKLGNDVGIISFCLPHMAIEPVAKQLNTRSWYSGVQIRKVTPATETVSKKILNSEVNVHVLFNDTTATVEDISDLKVGDVIQLEHKMGEPVRVILQNLPKFRASIGTKGSKYAVKITEIIKGEEESE